MDSDFGRKAGVWRTLLQLAALFLVVTLAAGSLWAQGTGVLAGLVTDPNGAVISNAKLELTNVATGEKRSGTTTAAGTYRFAPLPVVGTYTLTVEAQGFKKTQVAGIVVTVAAETTRNITMEIGAVTEVVNVEATAPLVQTTQASVSNLVDNLVWAQMPLEDRNQNTFINLGAGVVPNAVGGSTRGASVNGARGGTGNFLLEGFDVNDQGQGGRGAHSTSANGSGAIVSLSPDAIQEYRVITNNFNAEYGKGGGFINETVLRSGTNSWHGSAFWYNRIQALAANDFFSNRFGSKDRLVRNQGGGSLGGPIVKDKAFIYGTMEIHRLRQGFTANCNGCGITQQFLDFVNTGAFQTFMESDPAGYCVQNFGAACPGSFASSATLGPVFSAQFANPANNFALATVNTTCAQDPVPCQGLGVFSGDAVGFGFAPLTYPVPVWGDLSQAAPFSVNENRFSFKTDIKVTDKDQLTGTYAFQDFDAAYANGSYTTIGPSLLNPSRSQVAGIAWTRTFTPRVVNQFRFGYLRNRSDFPASVPDIPSAFTTFDPLQTTIGDAPNVPQFFTENQFQLKDDLSWVHGKHTFKMGMEYRRTRNGSSFQALSHGYFLFWDVENMVTDGFFGDEASIVSGANPAAGLPDNLGAFFLAQASVNPSIPGSGDPPIFYRGYRANEWAGYFQDEWRIHRNVTINMGIRWDYFGPPHNFQKGLDSNFYFGASTTPIPVSFGANNPNPFYPVNNPNAARVFNGFFQQRDHDIWNKDTNNFAPRLGFAWDVKGTGKFVVRGGFGIGYDRIWNNLFENIRFNAPFFSFNTLNSPLRGGTVGPLGPIFTPGIYTAPFQTTSRAQFNSPALAPAPSPRHMDEGFVAAYYEQTNFGFQWEFAKDFALEMNYIGTFGHKLPGIIDINTFNGRAACPPRATPYSATSACGIGLALAGLPLTGFSTQNVSSRVSGVQPLAGDNFRTGFGNSNYHALQTTVRKRFSYGLQFNANYTYGKALDFYSDAFNNRQGGRPTDGSNPHLDYGNADFDIRHRFVTSLYYELPFWKKNGLLGGWAISSIFSMQGGVPVPLVGSIDSNRDGYTTERPVFLGSGGLNNSRTGNNPADGYFDTSQFAALGSTAAGVVPCPVTANFGLWCLSPTRRGGLTGPGFRNWDFGVHKAFKITERVKLTYQANFFNILNHPNFLLPSGSMTSGSFGSSTSTLGDDGGHRITQMALRLDF